MIVLLFQSARKYIENQDAPEIQLARVYLDRHAFHFWSVIYSGYGGEECLLLLPSKYTPWTLRLIVNFSYLKPVEVDWQRYGIVDYPKISRLSPDRQRLYS